MIAINLKTDHMRNPMGIDVSNPCLSWNCKEGITQSAYEIEAVSNGAVIWNSKKVQTRQMHAVFGAETESRQKVSWRVRLWDERDEAGEWSEEAAFEMGILDKAQFTAKWINPELTCDPEIHKPASYLKTAFQAPAGQSARLYITCHGLYEAFLNGKRVGEFVLAPGTSTYDKKITCQTYDVTDLVREGNNEAMVILGDGWYRSCSGVDGDRNLYGEDIALFFQLEIDGVPVCVSDENWLASQDGPIRENDMQQGEVYDARMETPENWHEVKVEEFGTETLAASDSVPIVEAERFQGRIIITPNGETVIDYGQNLAGYIEFTLYAREGDTIVLTHGESLDENGNFTAENFQDRSRHKEGGTKQQVRFTAKEGLNHYKSKFTIWGFRYAKAETDMDLSNAAFTSIAVYSEMKQNGWFECSDQDVNQLVSNSRWSLKSNFCDVPTDCPTRERAAWTGDMGVFVDAGIYLEDCYPVIRKWLAECRLNQYDDGKVANIAPKNNLPTKFTEMLAGSVGWGDASIIVPYALYKRDGDVRILKENYGMMKKWYGFLEGRARQKGEKSVIEKENPYASYTIETGVDYGEWCEPDVNGMMAMAKPQYKVATAYYAYSGKLLAEIAEILGKTEDAAHYRTIAEHASKAFHLVATENGKIKSDRQAEYVRAISFGLLSREEAQEAAKDLNQMVIENGYHLNTGFLSTPSLCSVLADYGFVETAYKLLLQDTMPGWLYAVKKGATTIWENWDGINEKGEVKASLNHYSYGAVSGWLFSGVCGIKVNKEEVTIAPQPCRQLAYAKAVYESPLGELTSGWRYEGEQITYEITIPSNVTANVILPDGRQEKLSAGSYIF
ncbi:family 78 glycoside hydrolase catalytic domain [Anaerobium acetethylicum]|uniref:alpha-L-rhamnosidase n=1 Tax=Anaerobium acetethylicum TaxID=1619234 RepID=A0A1D3TST6_9FIRM|nr:family 78 glycoside hydrolase catalytic domain [Anaerobium acetethylicum]SCP96972.1 alpha-L-rhamnosidase [Anaerobium acetethylicum]